jgi:hypothetical protein
MLKWVAALSLIAVSALPLHAEAPYPIEWERQFGPNSIDEGMGVAADPFGNVFVSGTASGSIDGIQFFAGVRDAFLVKYDSTGNSLWSRQIGTAAFDFATSVSADGLGNAYLSGWTEAGIDGNSNLGTRDSFITKFNAGGNKLWTRQFGTNQADWINSSAVDGSGNLFASGITYGNFAAPHQGQGDAFLVKMDSNGSSLWSRQLGGSGIDEAWGVAVDAMGSAFITGRTATGLDGNIHVGHEDVFLTKYDSSGNKVWTRQFGSTNNDVARAIAVDSSGNLYVTGIWGGTAIGYPFDTFLSKHDSMGNLLWFRQSHIKFWDEGYSVQVDDQGDVLISGWASLDGGFDYAEAFVIKYDPMGNEIWSQQVWSDAERHSFQSISISLDPVGDVFVAGSITPINPSHSDVFLVKLSSPVVPEPAGLVLLLAGVPLFRGRMRVA